MKNNLIIIGNGFDVWQGLKTSYTKFKDYYYEHRKSIMKRMFIRMHELISSDGHSQQLSDVELIFGYPFALDELSCEFWNTFETSLGEVDHESINYFFGKEKSDLKDLSKSVKNARKILTKAFVEWVRTIDIPEVEQQYRFNNTCTFLNFNYTDTLQKRFNVREEDIYFIHGNARKKKSIIFGHSSMPEPPLLLMKQFGGRFEGLYYISNMLYLTDKHVSENIHDYIYYLAGSVINPKDIKNVYVLGHSFGEVDFEYFRFLIDATRETAAWNISCYNAEDEERVKSTMKKLKFSNYKIFKTIDDCISSFRT